MRVALGYVKKPVLVAVWISFLVSITVNAFPQLPVIIPPIMHGVILICALTISLRGGPIVPLTIAFLSLAIVIVAFTGETTVSDAAFADVLLCVVTLGMPTVFRIFKLAAARIRAQSTKIVQGW